MCKTLTDLQMLMHNLSKRNPTAKVVLFSYVVKPGTYLCVKTSRMLRYFLKHIVTDFRKPSWLICTKVSSINIRYNLR